MAGRTGRHRARPAAGSEEDLWISRRRSASPHRACTRSRFGCASSPRTSPTRIQWRRRRAAIPIVGDKSDFGKVYQPGNPAADASGYVLQPNVNNLIETADMKAAQRSYEANLNAIESARDMTMRTLDLIK
jgi:flagellar basal body rod protein FlgC